jgi:hypothetical protein
MKNLFIIAMLLASTVAYADNSVATPATPPGQAAGGAGGQGQGERFEERKAKVLAKIQERQACVQAATNHEAMKACFPHEGEGGEGRGGGQGRGGGFGGGRGQQGGTAPAAPQ